jgi:hypothetical protein
MAGRQLLSRFLRVARRFTNRPLSSLFCSHSSTSDYVDVDSFSASLQSISILALSNLPTKKKRKEKKRARSQKLARSERAAAGSRVANKRRREQRRHSTPLRRPTVPIIFSVPNPKAQHRGCWAQHHFPFIQPVELLFLKERC